MTPQGCSQQTQFMGNSTDNQPATFNKILQEEKKAQQRNLQIKVDLKDISLSCNVSYLAPKSNKEAENIYKVTGEMWMLIGYLMDIWMLDI